MSAKSRLGRGRRSRSVVSYRPSEREPYMNPRQLAYFRDRLLAWKADLEKAMEETRIKLREEVSPSSEPLDRAREDLDRSFEIRTRERHRKLMAKIDAALRRIEEGTYGYCEETGEPIGLKRLEARPIATLCLEAQIRHEREKKLREG